MRADRACTCRGWARSWCSGRRTEFGFVRLGEGYCSGSSLMPQKRNPDIAELLRGKAGARDRRRRRAADDQQGPDAGVQQGSAGVAGAALRRDRDRAAGRWPCCPGLIAALEFDTARMRAAADDPALGATDLAEELVRGGMPFRSAHEVVGRLVRHAEEKKVSLRDLSARGPARDRRGAVAENPAGAGSGARGRGAIARRWSRAGRGRARGRTPRGRAARRRTPTVARRSRRADLARGCDLRRAFARALPACRSCLVVAAEEVIDNGKSHQEKSGAKLRLRARAAWDPFRVMRDVLRWDPFRELEAAAAGDYGLFAPSFDVKENKDGYVFRADLPGVREDDLDISLTGNRLTISGQARTGKARTGRHVLRERTLVRQLQPRVHAARRHRRREREGRAEERRAAGDRSEEAGSAAAEDRDRRRKRAAAARRRPDAGHGRRCSAQRPSAAPPGSASCLSSLTATKEGRSER